MDSPVTAAKSALNVGFLVKTLVAVVILLSIISFARSKVSAIDSFFTALNFPTA